MRRPKATLTPISRGTGTGLGPTAPARAPGPGYGAEGDVWPPHAWPVPATLESTSALPNKVTITSEEEQPAPSRGVADEADDALAVMLNLIEEGTEWPTQMRAARAALLAKDPSDPHDPMKQRVLTVLSPLYRAWSGVI